ncbi:MAG: isoprenyl transferase [Armatimonadota bacterium]|nr:isoprenyl transferase [Armatimonadota bacterium]MDR7451577.1 isoprenyl transferase [Armatimonadota bacterium]MDR7467703.1 isoprenyl transferase [Armatimonadota bacterium]MDR7492546.1 isoprenyl transferase [Armatimonadota bacterium]MDR7500580.1 isoprenyl transferase [Armatimonadota bacterium]
MLDPTRVPAHIAIIMDGNGRWAASRALPRAEGHRAGVEAARRTFRACRDLGVRVLSLFAFSTENWRRPSDEVEALMQLLARTVREEADELVQGGVQLRVSGDLSRLEPSVRRDVEQVVALTRAHQAFVLNVAYSYGGRAEIVSAARRLSALVASGELAPGEITEEVFGRYLTTAGLPDPDLLIRTGGEQRLSNFLLWQIAYTELYFTDVHWPDFDRRHLEDAVAAYQRRRRRFGGVEGV